MNDQFIQSVLQSPVYDVAIRTPLVNAAKLSKTYQQNIYLKREDLQPVFSFKIRGAYHKIKSLSDKQKKQGVITASAGNHAQGVALSSQRLGIKATIVMPKTTPPIKVNSVKNYGAKTVLVGDTYDEALAYALNLADEKNISFIHPYDDKDVISGQATVGKEILDDYSKKIDAIFIPVGGGGLIAGIACYIKAIRPDIKIIAVEPENAACLDAALKENKRVTLKQIGIFVDGVAVKQIGKHPFEMAKDLIDDVILVDVDEICAAIKDNFEETRIVTEPAGALALAGLKKYCEKTKKKNQTLIAINSGANLNFDRLRHIAERADIGEHKEALFSVEIPETPGSFKAFCKLLGSRSVTEFNYRYNDTKTAHIFVGVGLEKGLDEKNDLLKRLKEQGYKAIDLTDNDLAKLHIRHMVGGKAPSLENEKLYRFQFPERPGALLTFLNKIGKKWNISLFHYRNHGAAYGRALVGIQIPKKDNAAFKDFLKELNYSHFDETNNPVYSLFL